MKPRFVLNCGLILLSKRVGLKLTWRQTWDHKGPVKLIQRVKIAHLVLQSVSSLFHLLF